MRFSFVLCLLVLGCSRPPPPLVAAPVVRPPPAALPPSAPAPRATLSVIRVDDSIDPLASVRDDSLPPGEGISIFSENVPLGVGKRGMTHFARLVLHDGETRRSGATRLLRWLDGVPPPAGAHWGLESVEEYDPDAKKSVLVGIRTFVLSGESALHQDDVTDATAIEQKVTGLGGGGSDFYVSVTLSPEGAKRFEDLTRDWLSRRAAILVDDEIFVSPIIRTVIPGGRISITVGLGSPDKMKADSEELARRLRAKSY